MDKNWTFHSQNSRIQVGSATDALSYARVLELEYYG